MKASNIKNIALSGDIGTGTSTLARNLSARVGWDHLNAGDFFRKWHQENNIPLERNDKIPEELDKKIDYGFQERMKKEEDVIFESHLAGWLAKDIPTTFKILLTCDWDVAMGRVSLRDSMTQEEADKKSSERTHILNEKFKRLYGVENCYDPKYFDITIDTTYFSAIQVMQQIVDILKEKEVL